MFKRILSGFLVLAMVFTFLTEYTLAASVPEHDTVMIQNEYIKIAVSKNNGGYVISTLEGDILKKSDNNVDLTHRGENFDTSFTSFRVDDKDFVFGTSGGNLTTTNTDISITSKWSKGDMIYQQTITLVNNAQSEQLGTAMITYAVKNNSSKTKTVKSRVLIDTQLGDKDYGYYEIPRQNLGQGYEYFEFERTWEGGSMPADYFVRDNPFTSSIVGYGVNSVFEDMKPYKMTFAHWANIASTVFDYTPDSSLNFTNPINDEKTGDSAAALYYDLGSIAAGKEKSFSTYYGVTANLKNKDNQILINSTAPTMLTLNKDKSAFIGTSGKEDGIVRINTTIANPLFSEKTYKNLAVVVYANGFTPQRQNDGGDWISYDNTTPIYSEVVNFAPGENRTTYFDFKFTPKESAELGSFVTKVFDMDTAVNSLGYYAEDYCLGTTENYIVIPGTDPTLPAITLNDLQPKILYNTDIRYMTVVGRGVNFFNATQLNKIELRGDNGITYEIPIDNLTIEQTKDGSAPTNASILLDEYMLPGRYQLHFLWKKDAGEEALQGVAEDFTSAAMTVFMTSDEAFRNDKYGVLAIVREFGDKIYGITSYKDETAFENAGIDEDDLLLTLRGPILKETKGGKTTYRIAGNNSDVNINNVLNYHGGSLTIEETGGTVTVLMDGKLTSIGANTTVRDGTAMFKLEKGTDYVVPTYDSDGVIVDGSELANGQDFIELKWNSAVDILQTIGGFLIDLRYGVLGKIQDADDSSKTYNVISFGGGLDLSFMTPGGAAAARDNKSKHGGWTQSTKGAWEWDAASAKYKPTGTGDIAPDLADETTISGGVNVYDVLYGGKDPGYLGINMNAHIEMPQIVAFLPNKIEGNIDIKTIGLYEVGAEAEVETSIFEMHLSFVIKESPSGAPIPDKLYFAIGGFEPGVNIDGMGVLWVTGGGGGFDNLYETIYGYDGVPPLKLLLHVDFDVAKILTGNADLELSLRSIDIRFSDLSLKMLEDAKFLEEGGISLAWYPNFSLTADAQINFMEFFKGQFQISAYSNADVAFFFEFMMRIALSLPSDIPIVGGMEIAALELGGGTEKMWGSIELLDLIQIGFTYWWSGEFEFSSGKLQKSPAFASNSENMGLMRTKALFAELSQPQEVQHNTETGETQNMSVGSNLHFVTGSVIVSDVEAKINEANNARLMRAFAAAAAVPSPSISTNAEGTVHLVQFADTGDYIMTISRADGTGITAEYLKSHIKVSHGSNPYTLKFYGESSGSGIYDNTTANVNVTNGIAYVIIPQEDINSGKNFVFRFDDGKSYDIGAIYVEPLSSLVSATASVSGQNLRVGWTGENISDTAVINVTLSDGKDNSGIIVAKGIAAKGKTSETITLPPTLAAGNYYVTLSLSDEGKSFDAYTIDLPVTVTNINAPAAPQSVKLANAGNDKMKVTITPNKNEDKLEGYFVDVYEDGKLIDAGLYWAKDDIDNILIGGRYDVPYVNDKGEPIVVDGKSYETLGYNPGSTYSVRVRAGNVKEEAEGEIYYCSPFVTSNKVELKAATPPSVKISYQNGAVTLKSNSKVTGMLYVNIDTVYDITNADSFTKEINLPDGEHTFEFRGADVDGDSVVVKEVISIDTTEPVIMLEAPLGGVFSGDRIDLMGRITDADSEVEVGVKINGEAFKLPENAFVGGILEGSLMLDSSKNLSNVTVEIVATDKAGNSATKLVGLTNPQAANVEEIAIYFDGQQLKNDKYNLTKIGNKAKLKVMGHLPDGSWIDVTGNDSVSLRLLGGKSVSLTDNTITAVSEGQTLLTATFDLGGGEMLQSGVVVLVGDKILYDALNNAILKAKALNKDDYTDKTWDVLQGALTNGKLIFTTDGVNQDIVNNAATTIINAIAGLEEKTPVEPVDPSDPSEPVDPSEPSEPSNPSNPGQGGEKDSDVRYYTVTFNTNGGNDVKSVEVVSGGKLAKPADPTKAKYTFTGWFMDKKLTTPYDFDKAVRGSFTLYAGWSENETQEDITPIPAAWQNPFTDVSESNWFYSDVEFVHIKGLFYGTSKTTFSPNEPMTRAMLVTVLWQQSGAPIVGGNTFKDVAKDAYYANAVNWAVQNGITQGMGNNLFVPDMEITREQMVTFLWNYAKFSNIDVSVDEDTNILAFTDVLEISDYAISAIQWAFEENIIQGRPNAILDPQGGATRAEVAAMLHRFLEE